MSPAAASCRNGVTPAYSRGGGERSGGATPAPRYPQGIGSGSGGGASAKGGWTGGEKLHGSVPEAVLEIRTVQVLDPQKRLAMQNRQQLRERAFSAERALLRAENDRKLMIAHMKAVKTILREVRQQALMPSAGAATPKFCLELPRLEIECLPKEKLRGRPEAAAFQDMVRSFMRIYQLAATRIEALLRESTQLRPAAQTPRYPTPAFHGSYESKRESTPPSSSEQHTDIDQSDKPEFWLLPAEGERSSSVKPKRDSTRSSTHMASQMTPEQAGRGSSIHLASSVTPDRAGTEPSKDIDFSLLPNRTYPVTSIHTRSSVTSFSDDSGSSTDISSSLILKETYTSVYMSSSVISDRDDTGSSKDISSNKILEGAAAWSSLDIFSYTIPDRAPSRTTMDIFSDTIPDGAPRRTKMDIFSDTIPDGAPRRTTMDIFSDTDAERVF
ncbi:uncharacterized protein [Pithys albifrons albifrons]|uniref:uncharacterized protein n=1 Tax=Pithys albifrons albifrons TaxID=3385563 RepID=UPI003A5CC831